MSLKTKIVFALFVVVSLLVAGDVALQRALVRKRFLQLEEKEALEHLQRAHSWLEAEVNHLGEIARHVGAWAADHGQTGGIQGPQSLTDLRIDVAYLCEPGGSVLWQRCEDPESREALQLHDFPQSSLSPSHPLSGEQSVCGFMMTERGLLAIGAETVGTERNARRIIVGRFMTDAVRERFSTQARCKLAFFSPDLLRERLGDSMVEHLTLGDQPVVAEVGDELLHVYEGINDIRGFPMAAVRVEFPRTISAQGYRAADDSLISSVGIAVFLLMLLAVMIQLIVLRPLHAVTAHAIAIGESNDTTRRLNLRRSDEIGVLAKELDRMVEELDASRKKNFEMARMAGISEMATGTLHSVGNVLNSVNVSASHAEKCLATTSFDDLARVAEALRKDEELKSLLDEHARGAGLVPLLDELSCAFENTRETALKEMRDLRGRIEHIMQLISAQQRFANLGVSKAWTSIDEEFDLALELAMRGKPEFEGIEIVREYCKDSLACLDRDKLLQVLVSLIVNGLQSIVASGRPEKRLSVRLKKEAETFRLEITDNGLGIPKASLDEIFNLGYSTREGAQGFGLHLSANSANEMGGSLRGDSAGDGAGATFTLVLPKMPKSEQELAMTRAAA